MELPKFSACSLDLTEGCNLACDYCFTYSKHKPKSLTREMGERIMDWWLPQMDMNKTVEIAFWGGEPLVKFKLLQHMRNYTFEKAKEIGIKDIIWGGTTNGVLYTPDVVEWTIANQCLMMVSLDGVQQAHDAHRKFPDGRGSWKIVDKNLREAKKLLPTQRVRLTLSPESVPYFHESMLYFMEDLDIGNIAYSPVYEATWTEEDFELLDEEFSKIVATMLDKKGRYTIKHINEEANIGDEDRPMIFNPCGAGSHYAGWGVDGFLWPCHRFNKHGKSFAERFNSPMILARPTADSFEWVNQDLRKEFYEFKDNPSKDCQGCDIFKKSACNGGCYAVNYDCTGDLHGHTEALCRIGKMQKKWGLVYRAEAEKQGIMVRDAGWDNGVIRTSEQQPKSCVCYNACYQEGTKDEIIHIDRRADYSCMCNHTNYTGPSQPQFRTVEHLDAEKKAMQRVMELSQHFLNELDEQDKKHPEKE